MQKKTVFLAIIFFFSPILLSHTIVLLGLSNAIAVHSMGSGSSNNNNSSTPGISKVASTVKYFDGKILVLENNTKYSLAGVKVLDLANSSRTKAKSLNIKVAEMTFVDGRLTEVTIRLQ